ncbi:hypothetical protein TPAU25S_00918 [Tsukamurella paurometabola]
MAFVIDRQPCEGAPRLGSMLLERTLGRGAGSGKLIAPYQPACSVDDCVLLISELATNAILYGRADRSGP